MVIEFIAEYRNLPELWNTNSATYSNRNAKALAYDKLLKIFNKYDATATRESVVKKINSLRTNFRKELKKVSDSKRSGVGTEKIYIPTLWFFDDLLFLTDQETPDSSRSTIVEEQEDSLFENEENNIITELDTSEIIEESVRTPKPKRRKQTDTSEEMFKMAIRELNKEDDEYLIMAKAYAVKLKKMTEEQRLYADQLIHQILLEGQLSRLSRCTTVSIQRELPRPPSSQTYSRPSSSESSYLVQPAERLIVIPTVPPEEYSYHSNSESDSCSAIQTFITEYNDV